MVSGIKKAIAALVASSLAVIADVAIAKDDITLGTSISPEMLLPVLVADRKGCFKKNEINLKIRALGGPATRDALMAGEINFALFHVAPVWISIEKGLPFKFVSMFYSKEIFGVLAAEKMRGKVRGVEDLKGLQGLTSTPGSASYAASIFFLKQNGLDVNADVRMTYLASTDPKIWLNALESEKVSFETGVWEPTFTIAVKTGIAFPLFDPADPDQHTRIYGGDMSTLGLVTTSQTIKSNPQLVRAAVACIDFGLGELLKESNDSLVDAMIAGGMSLDRGNLASVIRRIRGNFEATGKPSKSKYERAVQAYIKAGYLKKAIVYEDIIDPSFAGAAP